MVVLLFRLPINLLGRHNSIKDILYSIVVAAVVVVIVVVGGGDGGVGVGVAAALVGVTVAAAVTSDKNYDLTTDTALRPSGLMVMRPPQHRLRADSRK